VTERFPLESTLLFHASFGIAVANSIVFLGATLKDRKLMTLRQWLILQVVVLVRHTACPFGTFDSERLPERPQRDPPPPAFGYHLFDFPPPLRFLLLGRSLL
jgi:hypothetical protein